VKNRQQRDHNFLWLRPVGLAFAPLM
jgi:hypothetical protein